MKFLVDFTAGRLAKWLRILGFDTVWSSTKDEAQILRQARIEERMVITRNSRLLHKFSGNILLLRSDFLEPQIFQVISELNLYSEIRTFSRCSVCNQPLMSIDKEQARKLVPPYVFQTQDEFGYCSLCQKCYWKGTHWEAMVKKIEEILGKKG